MLFNPDSGNRVSGTPSVRVIPTGGIGIATGTGVGLAPPRVRHPASRSNPRARDKSAIYGYHEEPSGALAGGQVVLIHTPAPGSHPPLPSATLSMKRLVTVAIASAFLGSAGLLAISKALEATSQVRRAMESHVTSSAGEVAIDRSPAALAEVRRQLRSRSPGTYIGEMLLARDSSLARWRERTAEPIRVWIQPTASIVNWSSSYVEQVEAAFTAWESVGLPIRFAHVADSADAEVHVTWTDRFQQPISGRTKWARDGNWWITDAVIVLAVHHHGGQLLGDQAMHAMALHEIGHLIGLDHTADQQSIMASRVRVRSLSASDAATAKLLYSLPAGAVR
jgi:hypothetical protein